MESKLDVTNCVEVYLFAQQHMCEYLANKSKEFICGHFSELIRTREFCELDDPMLIMELFKCDELEIANEEMLLEALIKWLKHDLNSRSQHFERLFLDSIRLSLIESTYLSQFVVDFEHLLTSSPKSRGLIEYYLKFLNNSSNENETNGLLKKRQSPSWHVKSSTVFFASRWQL